MGQTISDSVSRDVDSLSSVIDSLMQSSAQGGFMNGFAVVSVLMLGLMGILVAIHLVNRGAGH